MKTLDRYIVRQFLMNFVILLAVLSLLFVAVNVIIDLDKYLEWGHKLVDSGRFTSVPLAALWCVLDFNGPMVLLLYVFFSGLVVVGAMGFTFAALYRTGELVAMMSSGVSMYRLAASVVIAGFILNCLALPSQEYLIPPLAGKLVRDKSQVGVTTVQPFPVHYAVDSRGNLLSAGAFDPNPPNAMVNVTILIRTSEGLAQERITAGKATWSESPQGWVLSDGRAIVPETAILPGGVGSVQPVEGVDFFPTELSPSILLAREASFFPRLLSLAELEKLSKSTAIDTGQIQQIIHSRFSLLVLNMLILVMGLPFFLLREPTNMLIQGCKAAGVTLGAWGVGLVLLQVGVGQLNPVAAAWLPVVIFLPVSAAMLLMVKT